MSITHSAIADAVLIAGSVGLIGVVAGLAWQTRFDHIFGISLLLLSLFLSMAFGLIP